jgi:hypothetical protein
MIDLQEADRRNPYRKSLLRSFIFRQILPISQTTPVGGLTIAATIANLLYRPQQPIEKVIDDSPTTYFPHFKFRICGNGTVRLFWRFVVGHG